ncbi:MAG: hypothetical protein DRM99_01715 [Thermoplasmata archaeon]|nr:MAG: hypothetical protein DRM99_01715 [Thermoplasmata archaeon]
MSNGKTIGMILFVLGIIILITYGLYKGFQDIETIDLIVAVGCGVLIIGLVTLFVSIVVEQQKDKKKMREEISKEDLEP